MIKNSCFLHEWCERVTATWDFWKSYLLVNFVPFIATGFQFLCCLYSLPDNHKSLQQTHDQKYLDFVSLIHLKDSQTKESSSTAAILSRITAERSLEIETEEPLWERLSTQPWEGSHISWRSSSEPAMQPYSCTGYTGSLLTLHVKLLEHQSLGFSSTHLECLRSLETFGILGTSIYHVQFH